MVTEGIPTGGCGHGPLTLAVEAFPGEFDGALTSGLDMPLFSARQFSLEELPRALLAWVLPNTFSDESEVIHSFNKHFSSICCPQAHSSVYIH